MYFLFFLFVEEGCVLDKQHNPLAELGVGGGSNGKGEGKQRLQGAFHLLYLYFYSSRIDGVVFSSEDTELSSLIQFYNVVCDEPLRADQRSVDD